MSEPRSAAECHVYCVAATILPVEKPTGDWVCGRPLAEHAKQVATLVPPGQVFVIDEKEIRL